MLQPRSATDRSAPGQAYDWGTLLASVDTAQLAPAVATPLPPKKRRRETTEPPKKRRRGEQGGLCRLNVDELYIIFAYIYPMDLLSVARTCKSLRILLMHKSSAFLWKTSLRRIEGLPECPADMTEPAYTNLVFYNRCHACDKPTKAVLWNIRRRFCPTCKVDRLCHIRIADQIIGNSDVLPCEQLTIGETSAQWVDVDQIMSLRRDRSRSIDETQLLNQKREQRQLIYSHARQCEYWQQRKGRIHRFDLEVLRNERQESIFERLMQLGYARELSYFRPKIIGKCNKSISKKYKALTDSEWDRIWPEWSAMMNGLRSQRLETLIYPARRRMLLNEYNRYVTNPPPDLPTFDLLPHVADLARFPAFRNIINAPEEAQQNDKPFAFAFAQLPILVDDWMKKLNSEMAALVKVPIFSSIDASTFEVQDMPVESAQTDLDKLHLACAVFRMGPTGAFAHPEVLSISMCNDVMYTTHDNHLDAIGAINGLQFLDEAPYVVRACGLDPTVATAQDMDHRNARLRCLACEGLTLVMNWRHAIWHARFYHCIGIGLAPLAESPRWQLISDQYIEKIQAVEQSVQKAFSPDWTRCLLCRPHVGDAMLHPHAVRHLTQCHHLRKEEIAEGVHYKLLGIRDVCVVEMLQRGEHMSFKVLKE